jgi:hypothetical protein
LGYICGKKMKWGKKQKRKTKKGGLRCGRLPPYLVRAVPLQRRDTTGVDLLASPSAGATCCGHASSCDLCASVPSRTGGTGARIRVERGVGGIVAVTSIAVEVWMSSS